MIGKLKGLVGGIQNRFTQPAPAQKARPHGVSDGFGSGGREALVREIGPRCLQGLARDGIAQATPAAHQADIRDAVLRTPSELEHVKAKGRRDGLSNDGIGQGPADDCIKLA